MSLSGLDCVQFESRKFMECKAAMKARKKGKLFFKMFSSGDSMTSCKENGSNSRMENLSNCHRECKPIYYSGVCWAFWGSSNDGPGFLLGSCSVTTFTLDNLLQMPNA